MSENHVEKSTCDAKHHGLEKRIENLDGDIRTVANEVSLMKTSVNSSMGRLHDKIEKFITRPSWATVTIITILASLSTGLIVKMLGN